MGGVDLKFGFDSDLFEIVTIIQGKIPDSCGWKIFNSREAVETEKEGMPQSMWQILAMAEFGPDSLRPVCFSINQPSSLARLIVRLDTSKFRTPFLDTIIPIYFLWADCTDNTVTNGSGDSLFISESVDELHSTDPSVLGARFPTSLGASSKCINSRAQNPPMRMIAFKNGGVHITNSPDSTK